jgi:heme-degrading monooxygenase HmoA
MIPQLRNIPGFQRFAAMRTNDSRYGGFSVYDTKEAVDQAAKMLNDWREKAGNRDPVAIEARGETGVSIVVNPRFEKGHGVARIYRTDASFDQVNAAIEQEAGETIRNLPGMLRYTTVRFEDGRIATLSACETQQAARNLTDKARELRSKAGSQLKKVLPNDPEVIEGEIMLSVMQ